MVERRNFRGLGLRGSRTFRAFRFPGYGGRAVFGFSSGDVERVVHLSALVPVLLPGLVLFELFVEAPFASETSTSAISVAKDSRDAGSHAILRYCVPPSVLLVGYSGLASFDKAT